MRPDLINVTNIMNRVCVTFLGWCKLVALSQWYFVVNSLVVDFLRSFCVKVQRNEGQKLFQSFVIVFEVCF